MKTPRELLLQKHKAVEENLDTVRAAALQQVRNVTRNAVQHEPHPDRRNFLIKVWSELVLPSRKVWGGLAAAWLLIVLANVAAVEEEAAVSTTAKHFDSPEEFMAAVQQRQRLMAELSALDAPPPPVDRTRGLRPRSERITSTRMA